MRGASPRCRASRSSRRSSRRRSDGCSMSDVMDTRHVGTLTQEGLHLRPGGALVPGLRRLRDPVGRAGLHARARHRAAQDRLRVAASAAAGASPTTWTRTACTASTGARPAIATGIATANPDLSVWVVTGDGDGLSIGGNHLIHALRRNVNLKILLFNNQIYGLTKGQYSPTSEEGKVTKSTPFGSVDHPFNPIAVALGAEATFVARTIDNDRQHLTEVLRQAAAHQGTAFVEIYQNCNVFNDGAFDLLREKPQGVHNQIRLVDGEPIIFDEGTKCVIVGDNGRLQVEAHRRGRPRPHRGARRRRAPVAAVRARAPVARARTSPRASACSATSSARSTARRCTRRLQQRRGTPGQGRPRHAAARRRHLDGRAPLGRRTPTAQRAGGAWNRASALRDDAPRSRAVLPRGPAGCRAARRPRPRCCSDPRPTRKLLTPGVPDVLEHRRGVAGLAGAEGARRDVEPAVVERHHQGRRVEALDAEAHEVRRAVGRVSVHAWRPARFRRCARAAVR